MDFYHVGVLHAKTFGAKFSWEDDQVQLKPRGGISIFYNAGPPTPGRGAAARQDAVARGPAGQLRLHRASCRRTARCSAASTACAS